MNQTQLYYLEFSLVSKACLFIGFLSDKTSSFYKVNAFLDRNDLPLNGLATMQGCATSATPLLNSCIRIHERVYFAVKCNDGEEKG